MPGTRKAALIRLAAGGTVVLTAFAASAADIPSKLPVKARAAAPALTAVDWTGFYLGGHAGGGWAMSRGTYDDTNDFGPIDFSSGGFLGGAQAGYLWQAGRLVYGVEIDGSWGSIESSRTDNEGDQQRMETKLLTSARIRTGATIDNALIFGTIGLAYVRSEFTVVGDVPNPASVDVNGFGLVSGVGAEFALAPNWSLRGEYLYYAINKDVGIPALTGDSSARDFVKLDGIHVARVAANYRFNASAARLAAPAANWTGLYLGAHGGYGLSRIIGGYDEDGNHGAFDIDPRGFAGGGQIGFNWQNGALVYGIEADGTWGGMEDDRTDLEGDRQTLKTTALASVRGRVGIAADQKLYYVTAGWGYAQSKLDVREAGVTSSVSFDSNGAVVGSGMDWAYTPNLSFRLEGLTYLLDNKVGTSTLTADSNAQDFVRQSTVKVIRAGVNYRFGGPN